MTIVLIQWNANKCPVYSSASCVCVKNNLFLFYISPKTEKSKTLHFRESVILRKVLVLLGFAEL